MKNSNDFSKDKRGAVISTRTEHVTPVGGNVFLDLGFPPDEAATLQAESRRIIREKHAARSHTEHVTPADGNVFLDLGFPPAEAGAMLAEADREIDAKLAAQSRRLSAKHLAENEAIDDSIGDGLGQHEQGEK